MASNNEPVSGSIPYALGMPAMMRIPIPGTSGLCIEFRPRGYIPKGGSTSTLFYQDIVGKRHLRLDFGYNVQSKTINFHWNQTGTHATFGVEDHTPVGRAGQALYGAAKYFRYAGRLLVLFGLAIDMASVVMATSPLRRASEVTSGWAFAWAGCKVVGAGGAALGTMVSPIGTAVGGVGGCIIGGYAGYRAGVAMGGTVYDWGRAAFTPLPRGKAP